MTQLVPYSFNTDSLPQVGVGVDLPQGQFQGVHFTVSADTAWFLDKIERWFENRDEVILIDHGTTANGLGFIILEWEECEVDPLFLAILRSEESVDDFTVYTRTEEV